MSQVLPASLLIVLISITACTPSTPEPSSPPLPLRVEFGGCWTIWSEQTEDKPLCQVEETLRLWVSTAPDVEAEIEVRQGPHRLSSSSASRDRVRPIQDGFLFLLDAPSRLSTVEVRAWLGEKERRWSLEIQPRPDWAREIRQIAFEKPPAVLEERLLSSSPKERGLMLSWLGRAYQIAGEPRRATETIDRAIEHHRRFGAFSQWLDDGMFKVHFLREKSRFEEAREELRTLPYPPAEFGNERHRIDYYFGLLALETGDPRAALRHLGDASRQAERLGDVVGQVQVQQILGLNLQWMGRFREALAVYDQLEVEGPRVLGGRPCELSDLYTNIGWQRLLAKEAGLDAPDPLPDLQKALDLRLRNECELSSYRDENIRLNIALAHVQNGRNDLAHQELKRAQASDEGRSQSSSPPPLRHLLWSRDLEARLALDEDRFEEALDIYREVEDLAADTLNLDGSWRAAIGRAQVYAAQGENEDAIRAFEEAEALLDRAVRQIPVNAGRDAFVAQRARGTRLFLDHLLVSGRPEQAFERARRSRLRGYRAALLQPSVERLAPEELRQWQQLRSRTTDVRGQIDHLAAEAWRVPGDRETLHRAELEDLRQEMARLVDEMSLLFEASTRTATDRLPAPREGELLLLYHPLPEGWVAFAQSFDRLTAQRLADLDPEASPEKLAKQLIAPFKAQIDEVQTLRILTSSALQGIDFHALPWPPDDGPLLASHAVVYGLDALPVDRPPASEERVVMVGDPNGNLPQAREEIEQIRRLLTAWTEPPEQIVLLGDEASPRRLREEIVHATRFHYAGHGQVTEDGWGSALPLADQGQLSVNDILALERVPPWIVLSGCQTGRVATQAGGSNIAGIAQAFLTRGARSVVAAIRPVEDQTAAQLMRLYYAEISAGVSKREALRRSQNLLRLQTPEADWASFRLFER